MNQSVTFWNNEGDEWLRRNRVRLPIKKDLVLTAFGELVGCLSENSKVLEIGCANGWRLAELKHRYGCSVTGIDPSEKAVEEATAQGIPAQRGCAHTLPFGENEFDLVIYGFCLYLCDRQDLFTIAKEGDRVLKDGGLMAIYDFNPIQPHKNAYKHLEGIWSYKQSYEGMFLWNPAYTKLRTVYHQDGQTKAVVMRKSLERGWPESALSV